MLSRKEQKKQPKLTDTINRVVFTPYTQTPIKNFEPDENHIRVMAFVRRHTMASSDTIHELVRDTVGLRNRHNFSEWIKELFDGQMLYKPQEQQYGTKNPDKNFHIYAVTKQGEQELAKRGLLVPVIRHSGPFRHQLMGATITAMKDIMCQRSGYRYIPGAEVIAALLRQNQNPADAKKVHVPFYFHGALIDDPRYDTFDPDMIDAIDYGGTYVIYIDEYNCHTETLEPTSNYRERSVLKTVMQMQRFVGQQQYRKAYGVNAAARFCYYTTNTRHAGNIVDVISRHVGRCPYMTVGVETHFEKIFKPPRMPVHLFEEGLARAGMTPWIIGKLPELKKTA